MIFGQSTEYNMRYIFILKSRRRWGTETSSTYLFFLISSGRHFSFNISWKTRTWTCSKSKLYKTLYCHSRDIINFNFLEKDLGLVSWPYFVYDFSKKIFIMLDSTNWPNFTVLIVYTSCNIAQCVYCSYLFPSFWRHKFWNWL